MSSHWVTDEISEAEHMVHDAYDDHLVGQFSPVAILREEWPLRAYQDDCSYSSERHCEILCKEVVRHQDDNHGQDQSSVEEEQRVVQVLFVTCIQMLVC